MKPKGLIGFGIAFLVALLLISIGVVGIKGNAEPIDIFVALMFVAGGIYLFLRSGYRLIKKLRLRDN